MEAVPGNLLTERDPPPFRVLAERPDAPFFVTCDHAGNVLPEALGDLGLSAAELSSHVAWDIGAAGVAERLATALPAFVILQTYSRLVIDCNRPLHVKSSIVEKSEYTEVPGNRDLSAAESRRRAEEVFFPYHRQIEAELARRGRESIETIYIALHSFTPRFMGTTRPWQVGVLYNRDARLARVMLDLLRREGDLVVGDNEPYQVSDLSDYGVVEYGEKRGLLHVELEIRQDLISDELGQVVWAERLARVLNDAREIVAEEANR